VSVIRFGAIASIVVVAVGMLVAGAISGSLLLIYLAIGVAALALLLLIIGVLVWRDEVFGESAVSDQVVPATRELSPAGAKEQASVAEQELPAGLGTRGRFAVPRTADGLTGESLAAESLAAESLPAASAPAGARPVETTPAESLAAGSLAAGSLAAESSSAGSLAAESRPATARPTPVASVVGASALDTGSGRGRRRRGSADRDEDAVPAPPAAPPPAEPDAGREAPVRPRDAAAAAMDESADEPRNHWPTGQGRLISRSPWDVEAVRPPSEPAEPDEREAPAAPDARISDAVISGAVISGGQGSVGERPGAEPPVVEEPAAETPETPEPEPEATRADGPPSVDELLRRAAAQAAAPARAFEPAEPVAVSATTAAEGGGPDTAGPDEAGADRADSEGADSDGAGADETDEGTGTMVSVVPGIARYHRADCLLIRFLGAEDLEVMTLPAAQASDCVPCKACRPES
jgi:hypothetical protein